MTSPTIRVLLNCELCKKDFTALAEHHREPDHSFCIRHFADGKNSPQFMILCHACEKAMISAVRKAIRLIRGQKEST